MEQLLPTKSLICDYLSIFPIYIRLLPKTRTPFTCHFKMLCLTFCVINGPTFGQSSHNNFFFPLLAKYREEFKLIMDRIAVVKSENVSREYCLSLLFRHTWSPEALNSEIIFNH